MKKLILFIWVLLLFGCKQTVGQKEVEKPKNTKTQMNPVKQHFAKMEADALKEPYKGIVTKDGKETGLFKVQATGISTAPIQNAASAFLNSLTSDQKERTTFDIDDEEWRKWCNVDNGIYDRQGVSLKEMNETQKKAAFNLMQVSLSAKGLQLSKDIMKTDQTLRELNNDSPSYDEELYFFTVMGTPSESEPWGWQLDGHHLIINYFVLGDQVVMSPVFMGGEPIITTTGKYKGNTLFQDEQNLGLSFMQSLPENQRNEATLSSSKTGDNNKASAYKDNITMNYEGLKVSEISKPHQEQLLHLASQYVTNIREDHHQIKMEEVIAHIDDTWFAWIGETTDDAVFYYRIHSPVLLIEFDHQRPIGISHNRSDGPTRNHIHTVVRTPNGNDYGKDLLRQHKEKHHQE